jgi:predicted nucleic acid-binding protein
MVVVDTNILAYLLIAGDRTREAQALYGRDSDWKSEAFLLVEFSNILASYQRLGELDPTRWKA